jgi:hypothetical protein
MKKIIFNLCVSAAIIISCTNSSAIKSDKEKPEHGGTIIAVGIGDKGKTIIMKEDKYVGIIYEKGSWESEKDKIIKEALTGDFWTHEERIILFEKEHGSKSLLRN